MKNLFKLGKIKLLAFLTPEPENQEEYVDKVVYLLRRDFSTKQQNEIILSITKKVAAAREIDMTEMSLKYERLQKDHFNLKQAILC
tara:strand:+ start:1540 stop:1797 length:258 start_codon:yes stop_codon:yes gene_type:complete